MNKEQFNILKTLIIAPLKEQGARVYIFGSRVLGHHHHHSDVDILYALEKDKSLPKAFISNLNEKIEDSRFPFKVDLVDDSDLADSYRESVESTRVQL